MADIFLSYAREDEVRARQLAEALELHGWNVWWDRRIPIGENFRSYIQQQLDAARCIVVLWSKASVDADFVHEEAHEGLEGRRLVPSLIDAVRLPLGFRQRQAADLTDWSGQPRHGEFDRLVRAIADIVPPPVKAPLMPESVERRVASPASRPVSARTKRSVPGPMAVAVGRPTFNSSAWNLPNDDLLGFVEIPAGVFLMGSDKSVDTQAFDDELPQHHVTLPAFFIGRYEVTVGQFKVCVSDGGCEPGNREALDGPDDLPVRYVSWHEALAYCRWLEAKLKSWDRTPIALADALRGRRDGRPWNVTLPSEAEWERAARGTDGRVYPWGSHFSPKMANGGEGRRGGPTPVGSFPGGASPDGLLDMSGNVWDWTRSLWGKNGAKPTYKYPYLPGDAERESLEAPDDVNRVLRGGAFGEIAGDLRAAGRSRVNPEESDVDVGFRVVLSRLRP